MHPESIVKLGYRFAGDPMKNFALCRKSEIVGLNGSRNFIFIVNYRLQTESGKFQYVNEDCHQISILSEFKRIN